MPIIQEIPENHHHQRRRHADTQSNPQQPLAPPKQPLENPKLNTNSAPRKLLFLFLKWIIMTFILSLFLIFIGFAAVILLHFLLTTTTTVRLHRRRGQTRQYFSPTNSLYSMQDLQDLLPHLIYSASAQTTTDCSICFEGFKEGELSRKLPDCSHLFHLNCVDNWLVKKPNCPVCRTRVQMDSGAFSGSRNCDDGGSFGGQLELEKGYEDCQEID